MSWKKRKKVIWFECDWKISDQTASLFWWKTFIPKHNYNLYNIFVRVHLKKNNKKNTFNYSINCSVTYLRAFKNDRSKNKYIMTLSWPESFVKKNSYENPYFHLWFQSNQVLMTCEPNCAKGFEEKKKVYWSCLWHWLTSFRYIQFIDNEKVCFYASTNIFVMLLLLVRCMVCMLFFIFLSNHFHVQWQCQRRRVWLFLIVTTPNWMCILALETTKNSLRLFYCILCCPRVLSIDFDWDSIPSNDD